MSIDFLAFGPHPDDAEIGAGGVLRKMKNFGYSTGIVDMTTGDMGPGTPEIRLAESEAAAKVLKLDLRVNMDLGDCRIEDSFENRCKAAALIRKHRPAVILAPYYRLPIGRGLGHNDHYKSGQILANAVNLAQVRKAPVEGPTHQTKAIWFYLVPPDKEATFVVDITDVFDDWIASIDCHQSQFNNPDRPRPGHLPHPYEVFENHARHWGWKVGAKYGQPFLATGPLKVDDPMVLLKAHLPGP